MNDSQRQACIGELLQTWKRAGDASRPPSVWIAEHGAVALPYSEYNYPSPVLNAWLLDDHGVTRRDPQEYVRFMTVQSGRHWAWGAPPPGIFSNTGRRPIGLAGFAPVAGTDLITLHVMWGGLWGQGSHYRYDAQAGALAWVADLWLS
ncbi:hypothetical protein [Massilia aquatica]|uniref:Uncharacterized protein n=1 Tax=Massilia aquatica TaxID=2609000 RepID=A0ABX0MDT9_9BURK|nr:hypothetical protein [Massilia aquatica]NHZ43135.1 hypothetical protein [Massilia aquatica]